MLEIGCGRGVALPVFHRLLEPALLVGVDLNRGFLTIASAQRPAARPARLVGGDVRRLPFPDSSFDMVIDFGTCYHIARPEEALAEIARVLAPSGIFATEARLSQLLSHPFRTRGRALPKPAGGLLPRRHALLWKSYQRRPATG